MGKQPKLPEKRAFIVQLNSGLYIAILVTIKEGIERVYANSDLLSDEKIKLWMKDYPAVEEIRAPIPDKINKWAKKISLIRSGIDQDTSDIPLDLSDYTPKEKLVIQAACRHVPVNEYYTYGQVAELAGLPAAYRFVGSTMRKCRQPWLIPCQRIRNSNFVKRWKSGKEPSVFKTPL
ncbi:MAG: MGMT family protein [Candidatus Hodarchaeales archaeon]